MSSFYLQNWDIATFILTNDNWEHNRVRMRRIMAEAVLTSFQS